MNAGRGSPEALLVRDRMRSRTNRLRLPLVRYLLWAMTVIVGVTLIVAWLVGLIRAQVRLIPYGFV